MHIRRDSRAESLIEQQLRSGRCHSAEQVVVSALEALRQKEQPFGQNDERRRAVLDMQEFAGRHGFTLGPGLCVRDLIHEGHRY